MSKHIGYKYIFIVLSWTYLFWIPAAILSHYRPGWHGVLLLHLAGGIGPLAASIYVVTKAGRWKEYVGRIIKVKGFSPYLWTLIISPILIGMITSVLSYGKILINQNFISAGIFYAVVLLFFGPIPEESGWRGVLFDDLCKHSIAKAQLITAGIWFIWHIPLFFIVGSYQYRIGFMTAGFFIWCVELIMQSIIMGYMYLLTKRSIASAILFHYFVNLTGEMIEKNVRYELIALLIYCAVTVVMICFVQMKKSGGDSLVTQ